MAETPPNKSPRVEEVDEDDDTPVSHIRPHVEEPDDDDDGPRRPTRPRLDPIAEEAEGPGYVFIFNQQMNNNAELLAERGLPVLKLAYHMAFTFHSDGGLRTWALGLPQSPNLLSIQYVLTNPEPRIQAEFDSLFANPIAAVDQQLTLIDTGNFSQQLPFLHIDVQDIQHLHSVIRFRYPSGHAGARVLLIDMPKVVVQGLIAIENHHILSLVDVIAEAEFNMSVLDIVRRVAPAGTSSANAFFTLATAINAYQPNSGVFLYYGGIQIIYYMPALYYSIGYAIIGHAVIGNSSILPSGYIVNTAKIASIQNLANAFHTIMHHPVLPFRSGGFAWLTLGVYDCVNQNVTAFKATNRLWQLQAPYLHIVVTTNNGNTYTQDIHLDPGQNMPIPHPMPTIIGNLVFLFANQVFQKNYEDLYNPKEGADVVKITEIQYSLLPTTLRAPVQLTGKGIDGNNVYWERLLLKPKKSALKGYLRNFVVFLSKSPTGVEMHGCIQRALSCKCKPSSADTAVVCSCPSPPICASVTVEDCCKMCKEQGDNFIIFVITIAKLDEHGKSEKNIQLEHIGTNYYSSTEGKVLFISMPLWDKVQGHCALWIPTEYKGRCRCEEYRHFLGKSRYNKVIPLLTGKDEISFCPICGFQYREEEAWSHFIRHNYRFVCPSCGLAYEEEEEFRYHVDYHCKTLPLSSTIVLSDEPIQFKANSDTSSWIHVYADLESAILPAEEDGRIHENILVGWVDDYSKKVTVADEIKEFFNAMVKLPSTDILIYFHNGEGYDFHFIVKDLCDCRQSFVKNFSIVGDSGQKIRFFSVTYRGKNLHFRDSFAFVSESLEKWVKSSLDSGCTFPCFNSTFDEHKRQILLRKNPFPYNAITHPEDLNRNIDELYGWATCDIAEELFCYKYTKEELLEFAKWLEDNYKQCGWTTVYSYYYDYLMCDVSQLMDVMEFFAHNVQEEFGINIHDYYGTPSLSWAAWLRKNKLPLEPISTSKRYDVVNSTIRGGQTGVFTRKYIQETEGGVMFDLDCNALYATVMLKFTYPCHDWREEDMPDNIPLFIEDLHSNGRSAFFEVDLTVKDNPFFYDYVPLASKRTIKGAYRYEAMQFYGTESPDVMFFKGLTQVIGRHEHYCCHSRNLYWYLTHDVIVLHKVHYILSGKDEPVFQEYVQHNLDQRKKYASDPIKKMLYKLLNNSLYGKTYEDETQRADYFLSPTASIDVNDHSKVRRVICEMGEWTLYEGQKTQYYVNKPIYLGACITEFSKLWMYQFYYDRVKIHYPDARVYYTDTDALTLFFPSRVACLLDLAKELNTEEEQIIDTSNFDSLPTELIHTRHNNEPGLFKSETGDHAIVKFIGLRAKTYIMVCDDGSIKMSVKGCPMKEKSKLKWEDFEKVLMSPGEGLKIEFDAIRSKYHLVRSVRLERVVLSADDRKRYILPDLIHTLPLFSEGHLEAIQV